jgi:hypothetical protein
MQVTEPSAIVLELPIIPFLKLTFQLSAQQTCHLPPEKGSMLRGAFGHALRSTVCVMKPNQECKTCMLRGQCIFTKIFDAYIDGDPPPFLKGLSEAPKPFIIDAYDEKTEFKKDECFNFSFTLLGRACEFNPYVIFAVSKMAEDGLAAQRLPFVCDSTFWTKYEDDKTYERLLYRGDTQCLCEAALASLPPKRKPLQSPLTLKFITPTRLKIKGRYTTEFSFRQLVFAMLRRALELAHFHVPDAQVSWEFREFLTQADGVTISKSNLQWLDVHRYSNRQHTKMEMGGFIGEIVLEGNIGPFSDLLRLSEVLHVGKGTSFGLGKMIIKKAQEESNGY